ncbi:hypothetical protein GCM10023331_08610 [Algivirga pacifica]|uniref:Arylsulfotransferase N-terminal domain-containing protein n=2 Tax=Algivirga pacifica TaxID=1162670 RepID=A0ABP9D564_9BACT
MLSSCQDKLNELNNFPEMGSVKLTLEELPLEDNHLPFLTGHPGNFSVHIYNTEHLNDEEASPLITYSQYDSIPLNVLLPAGTYTAQVHSQNTSEAYFDTLFYYYGENTFTIEGGTSQELSIPYQLSNSSIALTFGENVSSIFDSYFAIYSTDQKQLEISSNETRKGYFGPSNVAINISLVKNDNPFTLKKVIELDPKEAIELQVDLIKEDGQYWLSLDDTSTEEAFERKSIKSISWYSHTLEEVNASTHGEQLIELSTGGYVAMAENNAKTNSYLVSYNDFGVVIWEHTISNFTGSMTEIDEKLVVIGNYINDETPVAITFDHDGTITKEESIPLNGYVRAIHKLEDSPLKLLLTDTPGEQMKSLRFISLDDTFNVLNDLPLIENEFATSYYWGNYLIDAATQEETVVCFQDQLFRISATAVTKHTLEHLTYATDMMTNIQGEVVISGENTQEGNSILSKLNERNETLWSSNPSSTGDIIAFTHNSKDHYVTCIESHNYFTTYFVTVNEQGVVEETTYLTDRFTTPGDILSSSDNLGYIVTGGNINVTNTSSLFVAKLNQSRQLDIE